MCSSCMSPKPDIDKSIDEGLMLILNDLNSKKPDADLVLFDSIYRPKHLINEDKVYSDDKLISLFQKALDKILSKKMHIQHSDSLRNCTFYFRDPEYCIDSKTYFVGVSFNKYGECLTYEIFTKKSKLNIKIVEHIFIHMDSKLINVDSTKYDPNYVPLQIDSLPVKNINDLKNWGKSSLKKK